MKAKIIGRGRKMRRAELGGYTAKLSKWARKSKATAGLRRAGEKLTPEHLAPATLACAARPCTRG